MAYVEVRMIVFERVIEDLVNLVFYLVDSSYRVVIEDFGRHMGISIVVFMVVEKVIR